MVRLGHAWGTWRSLSRAQRQRLLRAWWLLPLVGTSLRWFGFRRTQTALRLSGAPDPMRRDLAAAQDTARIVHRAAHWNPAAGQCLVRSLVLHRLLAEQGLAADLRIGVARADGRLQAHAWVEHGGAALAEAMDVDTRYAAFDRAQPAGIW